MVLTLLWIFKLFYHAMAINANKETPSFIVPYISVEYVMQRKSTLVNILYVTQMKNKIYCCVCVSVCVCTCMCRRQVSKQNIFLDHSYTLFLRQGLPMILTLTAWLSSPASSRDHPVSMPPTLGLKMCASN